MKNILALLLGLYIGCFIFFLNTTSSFALCESNGIGCTNDEIIDSSLGKTDGRNYNNNTSTIDGNTYLKDANVSEAQLGKFSGADGLMSSQEISKMQETLRSINPDLAIDGKLGPETAAALAKYSDTSGGGNGDGISKSDPNTVIVTEKVPGADCKCIANGAQSSQALGKDEMGPPKPGIGESACDNIVYRKYQCTITAGGGLVGFQKIMAEITRVFVYITLLFGVLAIVGLGIGYAIFSGGDEEKTKLIKTYAINLMIGMILLFFFRYILVFLAPWIFQ